MGQVYGETKAHFLRRAAGDDGGTEGQPTGFITGEVRGVDVGSDRW